VQESSVADISSVYLNTDCVASDRRKLKKGHSSSADGFISDFVQFCADHPDFVVYEQLRVVMVICLQSPFMAAQLVHDSFQTDPVNGLVSDAAHGWWKLSSSLLVISSTYSPLLCCWVPGLFSYMNGASAEHYKCHFVVLFISIASEIKSSDVAVLDQMFAMVSVTIILKFS